MQIYNLRACHIVTLKHNSCQKDFSGLRNFLIFTKRHSGNILTGPLLPGMGLTSGLDWAIG